MKVENLWEMREDGDELKSVDELANRPWGVTVDEKNCSGSTICIRSTIRRSTWWHRRVGAGRSWTPRVRTFGFTKKEEGLTRPR